MRLRDRRVKDRHPSAAVYHATNRTRPYPFPANLISLSALWLVNTLSIAAKSRRRPPRPGTIIARDALLVGVAVLVIALSWAPARANRQLIWFRGESGVTKSYSLAVDDPQLPKLREQLQDWHERRPADNLAVTRWQKEIAEFYAAQLGSGDSEIIQVSFQPTSPTDRSQDANGPATGRYWLAVSGHCEQILRKQAEKLDRHLRQRGEPPVVFGKIIAAGWSPKTLGIAMAWGLLAAAAFSLWAKLLPHIELAGCNESEDSSQRDASGDLRFVIPGDWVRIHQPVGVRLRQATYAAVVLWALCCGLA